MALIRLQAIPALLCHKNQFLIINLIILLMFSSGYSNECNDTVPCGWKAWCNNNSCSCLNNNSVLHDNKRDCRKDGCDHISNCLECNAENKCIRCVNFIDETTHTCLDSCNGVSQVSLHGPLQGILCNESLINTSLWIGLGAGCGAGIILCLLVLLAVFACKKKKKQSANFQENLKSRHLPNEKIRKIPVFDNKGYAITSASSTTTTTTTTTAAATTPTTTTTAAAAAATTTTTTTTTDDNDDNNSDTNATTNSPETEEVNISDSCVIDEQVYFYKLEKMRPHKKTLEELLSQVRTRLRAMNSDDTRVPTYKGVINQLCRVLGLLNKNELNNSVPADALGLLEWAKQMLNDYYELRQQDSSTSSEAPRAEISSVDVQPIYAIPHDSCQDAVRIATDNKPSTLANHSAPKAVGTADSGYYSSVSIPYFNSHQPNKPSKPPAYLKKNKRHLNGYHVNDNNDRANNIYTCASSYSERSGKCMSTFIKDDISYVSECSERSSNSSAGASPEGLPFNMKDATEPIEV
ncbi:hybrid signal transduction protein dokA-like isoform X1 [Octopus sinensis]|uniref:Hybrid signal transduction protein dokA-like isoform X1 n=1 Tax=Octopus sinensis TaxID=2607531 RepID=A0A7E6FKP4_9MOLL|nr:hybrid signal transduction protein dokA-like isoform X1 [Octopus sinensis]XP_036367970.1 hybrid signal transduction protein dokA-like isoform X1 [Octopus sinensis]XP_036367971.1 hybrid signal transduction protein dokA-like isoform X1 [Octopus sinensis]